MFDEDVLPKHHPLHSYLDELGIENTEVGLPTITTTSGFKTACELIATAVIERLQGIFWLAEAFRPHITTGFRKGERTLKHASLFKDSSVCLATCVTLHLGLLPLILLGVSQAQSTLLRLLFLFVCGLVTVSITTALWMILIQRTLLGIHRATVTIRVHMKSVFIFLNELQLHLTVPSTNSDSTDHIYQILSHLWHHLKTYDSELIHLCIASREMASLECSLFSGLPKTHLTYIEEQIASKTDDTILLTDCKMLRELTMTLDTELLDLILGVIKCTPVHFIRIWFKLGLIVVRWARHAMRLQGQLARLNRIRLAIEDGRLSICHHQIEYESAPESEVQQSARKLLLQLFAAVIKTQELIKHVQSDRSQPIDSDSTVNLLSYLKLQLESCQQYQLELERLLTGSEEPSVEPASAATEPVSSSFVKQEPGVMVPAKDVIPEDDVVEDVAIGEGDQQDGDDKLSSVLPSMMPLHASVLNELRLAIADRRMQMQHRERAALQRRLQATGQTANHVPEVTESGDLNQPQQPAHHSSTHHDNDTALDRFFSSVHCNFPSDRNSRNRHPWKVSSAVQKRLAAFQRTQRRPTTNGVKTPAVVPRPVERPNHPLSGAAFASALLEQRRTIGYAEEDTFVAMGDVSDEELS